MNRIFYILIFATTLGTISGCFVDVPNPEDGTFLCHDDGDCADGYSCWDSVCQKSPDDGNDTDDRQCYNHGDCEADQNIEPELTYCAPDGFCKDPCDGQNCEENLICVRDLNASGAAHCADCSESGCLNNLEVCVDSTDGARCVPGCGHSDCAASSICYQVDGYSQPNVPSQISVCLDCPTSCDTGMMCGVSDATTTSYDYASTTCICDENSCPGLGVGYHCTDPTTSGINECTDYCGSDSDCSSGFACVDNFCERPICNENIECNAGEICRISSVDDTSKILSHCITNPCVPARCQTDETCAITLYGEQVFECLHIPPIGNSCFRNDECLNGGECFRAPDSGYFVHGFCAKSCGNDTECGTGEDCLNFQLSEYSSWYGACIESPGDALAECNYGCANGSACVEDKFSGQPYCRDETCRTDTDCDVGLECVHNPWRPDSNGSYGSCFETEATAGSCPTQSTVTTSRLSNDTDTQICDKGTLGACEYSGCTKMNDVCALLPTGYFGCTPVCDAMSPSPCFDGEECVAVWALPSDGTSRDLQLDHDVCIPIDGLRYGNDVTATSSGDTFWRLGEEPALSFYDDIEGYPFGGDASAWPVKMEKAGKVVATWFNDGSTKFFDADSLLEMNNSASTPCKTNARVLSVGDEEIGNAGAATGAWVLAECTSEQFGNDMLCPSLMFTPAESMVTLTLIQGWMEQCSGESFVLDHGGMGALKDGVVSLVTFDADLNTQIVWVDKLVHCATCNGAMGMTLPVALPEPWILPPTWNVIETAVSREMIALIIEDSAYPNQHSVVSVPLSYFEGHWDNAQLPLFRVNSVSGWYFDNLEVDQAFISYASTDMTQRELYTYALKLLEPSTSSKVWSGSILSSTSTYSRSSGSLSRGFSAWPEQGDSRAMILYEVAFTEAVNFNSISFPTSDLWHPTIDANWTDVDVYWVNGANNQATLNKSKIVPGVVVQTLNSGPGNPTVQIGYDDGTNYRILKEYSANMGGEYTVPQNQTITFKTKDDTVELDWCIYSCPAGFQSRGNVFTYSFGDLAAGETVHLVIAQP